MAQSKTYKIIECLESIPIIKFHPEKITTLYLRHIIHNEFIIQQRCLNTQ